MVTWSALLCKVFGHDWHLHLVNGDDGEPSEQKCTTCGRVEVYLGICRCLPRRCRVEDYCVCLEGLFHAVQNGALPRHPIAKPHSEWWPYAASIEEGLRAAFQERESRQMRVDPPGRREDENDAALSPVVLPLPRIESP